MMIQIYVIKLSDELYWHLRVTCQEEEEDGKQSVWEIFIVFAPISLSGGA